MRNCDLCGERYGQEHYADVDGQRFIGHKSCMEQIERMAEKEAKEP